MEEEKCKKILLVEDQPVIQQLLVKLLRRNCYVVDECSNGREAKAQFLRKKYDLIITDLHMPYGDGFELLNFIQEQSEPSEPKQNVLIITSNSNMNDLDTDKKSYIDQNYMLFKPFTKKELLQSLETVFAHKVQ